MTTRRLLVATVSIFCYSCAMTDAEYARSAGQCAEVGLKAFESYKARLAERYNSPGLVDPPEFHFSKRRNTCLMKVGHWSFLPDPLADPRQRDSDLLNEVIDVYSGRTVISGGHENRWLKDELKTALIGTDPLHFDEKAKAMMSD